MGWSRLVPSLRLYVRLDQGRYLIFLNTQLYVSFESMSKQTIAQHFSSLGCPPSCAPIIIHTCLSIVILGIDSRWTSHPWAETNICHQTWYNISVINHPRKKNIENTSSSPFVSTIAYSLATRHPGPWLPAVQSTPATTWTPPPCRVRCPGRACDLHGCFWGLDAEGREV